MTTDQATHASPERSQRGWNSGSLRRCLPQILFVLLVWLGLLAAGGGYIVKYAVRTPMRDDWGFVSGLTDRAGVWRWIREPWVAAKSRVPFQKAAIYATWNANHADLRPLYLACHVGLAVTALIATAGAAILRGGCDYSDAFLSLVLLNPGNWFYQIEAYRIYTPLYTSLCVLLTVSFLFYERYTRPAFVAGCCGMLLFLMLQHALGVASSSCFLGGILAALWITRSRNVAWKLSASIAVVTALLWAIYIGFHFRDCMSADDAQGTQSLAGKLTSALQFLTTSLGTYSRRFWPATGGLMLLVVFGTVALLGAAGLSRRNDVQRRVQALLLLFPLASSLLVAIGIGSVRDMQGGLHAHYSSYSSVLLVFLYLGWLLVGRSEMRGFVQICAFALACSSATTEAALSLQRGEKQKETEQQFRRLAAGGASITQVVSEFGEKLSSNEDAFASGLADLYRAKIEPYRSIDMFPSELIQPIPLDQVEARGMEHLGDHRWRGDSSSSFFLIKTSTDRPIKALRVQYSLHKSAHIAVMEIRWPASEPEFPNLGYQSVEGLVGFVKGKPMTDQVRTFWTGEARAGQFSFHPSRNKFEIELHDVSLLLPDAKPAAQ